MTRTQATLLVGLGVLGWTLLFLALSFQVVGLGLLGGALIGSCTMFFTLIALGWRPR